MVIRVDGGGDFGQILDDDDKPPFLLLITFSTPLTLSEKSRKRVVKTRDSSDTPGIQIEPGLNHD